MNRVTVDGAEVRVPKGSTALDAARAVGIDIPTLCHDDRVSPSTACRVCLVEVEGFARPVAACGFEVCDGSVVRTNTDSIRRAREGVLRFLAREYPMAEARAYPEKPFHKLLAEYQLINERNGEIAPSLVDDSNPYFVFNPAACIECYKCVKICDEVEGAFVWQIVGKRGESRVVPDSLSTLAQSSCKSCGACVEGCPTSALLDKTRIESGVPDSWKRTTCPYCGVGCELFAGTKNGRLIQSLPVRDAPVNKGHLCVKGRYAHQYVHAEDRITKPMIRRGGEFVEVTWDEALELVASRFREMRDANGPDSIGVLGSARAPNEDNYVTQKFARVVIGTNNVDCCARVCHAPTGTAMKQLLGTGAATNSYDDIEVAKTILVSGSNPTENHPIVGERIKQASLKGAKLIVVDPRKIELERFAEVHLQIHPGTNVPLYNAMANVLLEEGLYDKEFAERRIAEMDEFRQAVSEWTADRAAEVCGVSAEDIRRASRLFATHTPAMSVHGLGMTEHLQGTEGVMCLVNLALLTGNIGKPGAGVNPLRGQNNVQGSGHMGCEPRSLTGFVPLTDAAAQFSARWGVQVSDRPGLTSMEMLDAAREGTLKAMWIIGYDLYLSNPNAAESREAFEQMEFVVVQDMFMNETAREFAHVFLPAASSFEREGTFMNAERRVQLIRKVIEPPGEAKSDWEIVQEVANRMGYQEGFAFTSAEEIWDEVRELWPEGAGLSYRRLRVEGIQWPCPDEDHPGTKVMHTEEFPFGVKTKLRAIPYIPTPEVTDERFPMLLNTGRNLYQFNAATMTDRTKNREIRPTDTLDIHPEDAKRLGIRSGSKVRIVSRYGDAEIGVRLDSRVRRGELFATFHDARILLNRVTSNVRDRKVKSPEYKVTAVRVEPISN